MWVITMSFVGKKIKIRIEYASREIEMHNIFFDIKYRSDKYIKLVLQIYKFILIDIIVYSINNYSLIKI